MSIVGDGPSLDDNPQAGSFRFFLRGQRWEWSTEVERIHGYERGDVRPTTELVLSHKHPDDRAQVEAKLDEVVRNGNPFCTRHRIIDVQGRVHVVVVVGDGLLDDTGTVVGTQGFYIDVTPIEGDYQQSVTDAVTEIAENRGAIEQAKGMLMLVYRIDAEAAFDLLRWRSQATNVKLRAICDQIVADFIGLDYRDVLPPRSAYDQLLLTAHERIAPDS